MAVLIQADHNDKTLSESCARLITAAKLLDPEVDVFVAGHDIGRVADAACALAGVRRVIVADDPVYEHMFAEPVAGLIEKMAGDYQGLLAAAGSSGKDVLPRVAARLDVMQISDVTDIKGDLFVRPIYAGNAVETVRSKDAFKVVTVRISSFDPVGTATTPAPKEISAVPIEAAQTTYVGLEASVSDRPDLGTAKIVVSGGRALGSKEKFDATILPLAEKLNAAIGASRAAVDSGYVPNDCQVGQTGKIVAPELYIACGISGAIQHVAGMKESKVIVAINSDADAPIFSVADYGLVADIFQAIPELTAKL